MVPEVVAITTIGSIIATITVVAASYMLNNPSCSVSNLSIIVDH